MASIRRDLLRYAEFLRESGYLFAEGGAEPEPPAVRIQPPPERAPERVPQRPPDRPKPRPAAAPRAVSRPAAPVIAPESSKPTAPGPPASAPQSSLAAPARRANPFEGPPLPQAEREKRFADGLARADACRACALGAGRNRVVYSDGGPMSRICFVGEAPGADEDRQGVPFVGRGGQLLTKMIQAVGFAREEVYICNTIKCRPPENRDPLPSEKAACEHFLFEQLGILRPQIIVALGRHAACYLTGQETSLGSMRRRWHDWHGVALMVTYHPAFLLRSPNYKKSAWEDMQMLHARYTELNPDDPRKIWQGQ